MPELAEVETVVRGLKPHIEGKKITAVKSYVPKLRFQLPTNFQQKLHNSKIVDVTRRGKYILILLDNDMILLSHLGMTGIYLYQQQKNYIAKKHDHIIFEFDDGILIYNDVRKFGYMDCFPAAELNTHILLSRLGPEPLTADFNSDYLALKLKSRKKPIKNLLMDAEIVVGVGNIYACESLFRAQINPTLQANMLSKHQIDQIVMQIKQVLTEAIDAGGSTLKNFIDSSGEHGYFQMNFNVYGRKDSVCKICKDIIVRIKQAGRSSFYCPTCQK